MITLIKKKERNALSNRTNKSAKKDTHRTSVIITLKTIQPYFVPLTFIPKIKNTQRKNQQSVHLKRMKKKMTSIDEK